MAHDRSGIATIDGAEGHRVEMPRAGYVWAAAVAAAVVAALLLVALSAAGAVDFLRRDERQDQTAVALQGESASTSSDSLDTFMEDGQVVDGEDGAPGADGRGADAAGALAKLLVTAVALVVLLFAAVGLAVLLFAAALWAAMRGRRPVTRR